MHYLMIPGIDGSGPEHWQSLWEAEWGRQASRISVSSWTRPELDDWCDAIDRAVTATGAARTVLVAHSLGCPAAARWAARPRAGIAGVFLVAPPDRAGALFPAAAATFAAAAEEPVRAVGLIVSSDDDPYCSGDAASRLAAAWALPRVSAGPVGHVNSASRLGRWDAGRALLTAFTAGLRAERVTDRLAGPRLPSDLERYHADPPLPIRHAASLIGRVRVIWARLPGLPRLAGARNG